MTRRGLSTVRWIVLLCVLGALVAGTISIVRAVMLPVVQITHVTRGDVVQAFYATGTIVPEREFPIKAQVSGVLMLEPGIDKGSVVQKNQLIGRVISEDLEKKLRQAEAELKEKRARADEKESPVLAEFDRRIEAVAEILASQQREHRRVVNLAEQNVAQQVEVDRAFERMKATWADLEAAKAQRKSKLLELQKELDVAIGNHGIAKWNIDQQELRSPVDGVVLDWPVPSRTRVAVNDHVLMGADVRPERLVMRAQVDEEDRAELFLGQPVRMTLYSFPEDKFNGKVKTIYAKADPQRRTFEVDVEIVREGAATPTRPASRATSRPKALPQDRFAAGMTGELAFVEDERVDCSILPRQALQGDWFYVVRNGKLERIKAQAGVKNVTRVEVLGGVEASEPIVISPIGKMEIGQAVRTQFVDPRVAADMNKPKDTGVFKGGF